MNRLILGGLLPALMLSACASQSGKLAPDGPKGDLKASLPYLRMEIDNTKTCKGVVTSDRLDSQQGSYYVRLGALYSSQDADTAMAYGVRTRPMLLRALWSDKTGFTLTATITVDSQPAYQATVPLYAVSHDSGQQGESFTTNLDLIWQNTFIKVQPGATLNVQFESKFSKTVETGALSAALRVAKVATTAMAPEAKILTTLNQGRMQTEARLWDKALGQLFAQNATEQISLVTTPEQIGSNSCGVVTLYAPGYNEEIDPQMKIGTWRVGVNDWRRSIFTDAACLTKALDGGCASDVISKLTPMRVLDEPVGGGKSIGTFLKEQDIVPIAISQTDSEVQKQEASSFCRRVTTSLVSLGLTDIDAKLGLWAFAMGYPMPTEISDALTQHPDCQNQIRPFEFRLPVSLGTSR
ncbi:hypothetical protein [Paramagnetospirillum magneticum]|uniref:Uncharacterized protein n=1 Tax=Paramagnetospirillum magneticum (strain ATCC 700264 / AMB-1) TaxID=342108 RepID=Q2W701_PARM1|nr:hypothetical protein [Paramagnetospirillum magneticum]BAE50374.1 hypothetical protein amb1570 [Paramagnetospirillum magneticum AMB-1]